jgi:hypothetical protein
MLNKGISDKFACGQSKETSFSLKSPLTEMLPSENGPDSKKWPIPATHKPILSTILYENPDFRPVLVLLTTEPIITAALKASGDDPNVLCDYGYFLQSAFR